MIAVGCDVGSLFVKAVVLRDDAILAAKIVRTTGTVARELPALLQATLQAAGVSRKEVACLAGTGAGGEFVPEADFVEDTLACAAAAARYFCPEVRYSIDIGGQSIASLLVGEEGQVRNFMRNDKCASGSGRFLEVMSEKLGVGIAEIDAAAAGSNRAVELSNQCGVFAESEVISHLNNGESVADILAGVCAAVGKMVSAQGRRFGVAGPFTLTGGVARVKTIAEIVRERLGREYHPFPLDPQLAAAVGAALLGDSGPDGSV